MSAPIYADIALFSAPFSTLSYILPECFSSSFWRPGLRLVVPVGKSVRCGCIVLISATPPGKNIKQYKEAIWPLENEPLIGEELLFISRELSIRLGTTLGAVLANALPAGLRIARANMRRDGETGHIAVDRPGLLTDAEKYSLARALEEGRAHFLANCVSQEQTQVCALNVSPPWPVRPAAKKQVEILEYLYARGQTGKKALIDAFGPSCRAPLAALIKAGHIAIGLEETDEPTQIQQVPELFQLNGEQRLAFESLVQGLLDEKPQTRLLYGITGSGKTAVYIEFAKFCMERGRSIILLAPEVALAHKLFLDVRKAIPDQRIILYHGYQSPQQREKTYRCCAAQGEPHIVVGTRSALFLPVFRLGCIILDEEHDASYKQDERLPYHAKEVAQARINHVGGVLVLGSATPDLRVFYASRTGKLPISVLSSRATGGSLPKIELAKITGVSGIGGAHGSQGLLTEEARDSLRECLRKNEQAVILLNRRGYAPLVYCLACGKTIRCPYCDIGMAFHKNAGRLLCHYCGYNLPWPAPCPECGDMNYLPVGEGTEKIAEQLEIMAGQPILRLDRDSVRKKGEIDSLLRKFGAGKSPFLVGTQMLSKGHHFPNVTLVIVADGDIGLNMPDYRAAERTFQLLTQAAGRAGRGEKPGRAIIQTRDANHYCWRHVMEHDYVGFFETELSLREKYGYPPFTRLGLLRISFAAGEKDGRKLVQALGNDLRIFAQKKVMGFLGPAPAPLPMINGRARFHCLIKADSWQPMREIWFYAQKHREAARLRMLLDLDPVNML